MPVARKFVLRIASVALSAAVVAAVGVQFWKVLSDPAFAGRPIPVRVPWLLAAGLLYLAAHTLFATFWWQLLRSQGATVGWFEATRAYFVSQVGKYLPGKVWVIGMRIGLLRDRAPKWVVGVTGVYETLTNMAAGALLGIVLLPYTRVVKIPVANYEYFLVLIAAFPLTAGVLNKLLARVAAKRRGPDAPPLVAPPVPLLALGLLQAAAAWCLLGASIGCVVAAVGPTGDFDPADFPAWLAAVGVAYVVGFLVLISPGGLGPREFLLKELLTPTLNGDAGVAVVVALATRLAWTGFEAVAAGGLYLSRRRSP